MKNKKNLILVSVVLIFLLGLLYNSYKSRDILKNKMQTIGEITDFTFSNNAYYIDYTYEVDGVVYKDSETVHYFECDDGNPGCVGIKFTVFYSKKNPKFSQIDLGEFNDKKFKY